MSVDCVSAVDGVVVSAARYTCVTTSRGNRPATSNPPTLPRTPVQRTGPPTTTTSKPADPPPTTTPSTAAGAGKRSRSALSCWMAGGVWEGWVVCGVVCVVGVVV